MLHTENAWFKYAINSDKGPINDERSLISGSNSLLKYSNNGDAVSLKYCENDGSLLLLFTNNK